MHVFQLGFDDDWKDNFIQDSIKSTFIPRSNSSPKVLLTGQSMGQLESPVQMTYSSSGKENRTKDTKN
jgi:hypothetical protein